MRRATRLLVAVLMAGAIALAFKSYLGPDMAIHYQNLLRACGL